MITEKNVANLLIIGSVATTQTAAASVNPAIMNDLEGVVTYPGGIVPDANAAVTSPLFKIGAKQTNGSMKWSDVIDANQIVSVTTNRFATLRDQIDYVGFNGTAGAIDPINSNLYTVRMYVRPTDKAGFMQQIIKRGTYKSTAAATQYAIANGITNSLINNFSREHIKYARFAKVNSAAVTAFVIAGSYTNWTVTEGSEFIVSSQAHGLGGAGTAVRLNLAGLAYDGVTVNATTVRIDSKWNFPSGVVIGPDSTALPDADTTDAGVVTLSQNHGVAVGTTVYIGIADNGAAANTAIHYSGVATAAAVLSIDRNYAGTANANCVLGGGTRAADGNWGIRIQGEHYATNPPNFFYSIPYFETLLEDWGTTTVTNDVTPFEGLGTLHKVREMEQQFQGSEGNFYRAQVPSPTFRTDATNAAGYSVTIITYVDNMTTTLGQSAVSHKQLYIAWARPATGTTVTNANTGVAIALNRFFAQYGVPTNTAAIHTEVAA